MHVRPRLAAALLALSVTNDPAEVRRILSEY